MWYWIEIFFFWLRQVNICCLSRLWLFSLLMARWSSTVAIQPSEDFGFNIIHVYNIFFQSLSRFKNSKFAILGPEELVLIGWFLQSCKYTYWNLQGFFYWKNFLEVLIHVFLTSLKFSDFETTLSIIITQYLKCLI